MTLPLPTSSRRGELAAGLRKTPLWLVVAVLLGVFFLWVLLTDPAYEVIFGAVLKGVGITVRVTIIAYALAVVLGLLIGLARVSSRRLTNEVASFYVEIIRGVPMLVLLYYIVFAGAPGLVQGINWVGSQLLSAEILPKPATSLAELNVRQIDFTLRVIVALSIGYSAFLAEVFRAGIESIERGQTEAARSLGMGYWQAMRHVVLPQAIRRVLPPLGNDFIAMLKDSSLVSAIGLAELAMAARTVAGAYSRYWEPYLAISLVYLVLTGILTLLARRLETPVEMRGR